MTTSVVGRGGRLAPLRLARWPVEAGDRRKAAPDRAAGNLGDRDRAPHSLARPGRRDRAQRAAPSPEREAASDSSHRSVLVQIGVFQGARWRAIRDCHRRTWVRGGRAAARGGNEVFANREFQARTIGEQRIQGFRSIGGFRGGFGGMTPPSTARRTGQGAAH